MSIHKTQSPARRGPMTFAESFEQALAVLKRSTGVALRAGAIASALALGPGGALVACAVEGADAPATLPDILGGDTSADWFHDEGERNPEMVSYLGSSWHEYYDCNTRGGCMGVAVFLKVRVQPVAFAELDSKRVGVQYSDPGGQTVTAEGRYYTTYEDGAEEWHVRVDRRAYDNGVIRFAAWYQDGQGRTFYDDNAGEGHVEAYQGQYSVIRHDWGSAAGVTVDDEGVHGSIAMILADLDFDKDVRLVWTTDGWETVNELGMGAPGTPNAFGWVEDLWGGYERWAIDLQLPGPAERFEYAVVYRHGVVNGAEQYEFWDNNGGLNYVVERAR